MAGLPCAADRQSKVGQLRIQERGRVSASGAGMSGEHGGVAGQFLVKPQLGGGQVHQRVEPEHAAHRAGQGVHGQVAAAQVHAFVRQHQFALLRVVALLEIGRHDDARAQQADHHRADVVGTGLPQTRVALLQLAQAATEAALLHQQPAGHGQSPGGPGQQGGGEHADLRVPGHRGDRRGGMRGQAGDGWASGQVG